jgi:hypothetical protein
MKRRRGCPCDGTIETKPTEHGAARPTTNNRHQPAPAGRHRSTPGSKAPVTCTLCASTVSRASASLCARSHRSSEQWFLQVILPIIRAAENGAALRGGCWAEGRRHLATARSLARAAAAAQRPSSASVRTDMDAPLDALSSARALSAQIIQREPAGQPVPFRVGRFPVIPSAGAGRALISIASHGSGAHRAGRWRIRERRRSRVRRIARQPFV